MRTLCFCESSRDGSVIYGNNEKGMTRVRTFKDGRLKISEDGLLEHDEKGIPISGDARNCWAGFSLIQALFVKEHNAVCDMLKVSVPSFHLLHMLSPVTAFAIVVYCKPLLNFYNLKSPNIIYVPLRFLFHNNTLNFLFIRL